MGKMNSREAYAVIRQILQMVDFTEAEELSADALARCIENEEFTSIISGQVMEELVNRTSPGEVEAYLGGAMNDFDEQRMVQLETNIEDAVYNTSYLILLKGDGNGHS